MQHGGWPGGVWAARTSLPCSRTCMRLRPGRRAAGQRQRAHTPLCPAGGCLPPPHPGIACSTAAPTSAALKGVCTPPQQRPHSSAHLNVRWALLQRRHSSTPTTAPTSAAPPQQWPPTSAGRPAPRAPPAAAGGPSQGPASDPATAWAPGAQPAAPPAAQTCSTCDSRRRRSRGRVGQGGREKQRAGGSGMRGRQQQHGATHPGATPVSPVALTPPSPGLQAPPQHAWQQVSKVHTGPAQASTLPVQAPGGGGRDPAPARWWRWLRWWTHLSLARPTSDCSTTLSRPAAVARAVASSPTTTLVAA